MADPGQTVVENTAVLVRPDGSVEARFTAGLPAAGRRILGRQAERLLLDVLPELVANTLLRTAHDPADVLRHIQVNEDADVLRRQLDPKGLVAFIADGAVLPRMSGVDDRPLVGEGARVFVSPPSLRVTLERRHGGPLSGMGIRKGVTLLVGGGYHGKSTVLEAVARGVYNHRPGDGRECVVTDRTAMKIQAEDGRSVAGVDISPFIGALPGGQDTSSFSTPNASGSTSQAAAIIEAVESGSRLLLIDEDTAATNFMIRDRRMQALVPGDDEPITPFIDRVESLYRDARVSTLLVIGGSGDYLDVAHEVVAMLRYRARNVTQAAHRVAARHPTGRQRTSGAPRWPERHRVIDPGSIDPRRGRQGTFVRARGRSEATIGRVDLDLSGISQIVLRGQARAIALALVQARHYMKSGAVVEDILDGVARLMESGGLDALDTSLAGDLFMPRTQDIAAALGRLRTLTLTSGHPVSGARPPLRNRSGPASFEER